MPASSPAGLQAWLGRELRVSPERQARMIRMTVCASVLATVFLVFRVPLAAYGTYVVLLVMQRDAAASIKLAVGALTAGLIAVTLSLLLYMFDIDEPGLRLPVMACVTFLAMYLAQRPAFGPLTFLTGFLMVDTQTLIDQVPEPEALTHLLLWLLLVLASACVLGASVELGFGRSSAQLFRDGLAERRRAALSSQAPASSVPVPAWLELGLLARRLGGEAMMRLADALRSERATAWARLYPSGNTDRPSRPSTTPAALPEADHPAVKPASNASREARQQSVRFAVKATLAAMVCYITYSAVDWPGIHTAVPTCFFVALGSIGETLHKLSLRLAGALLGGLMAGLAIVYLFPLTDDIGAFLVLFAAVTFFCTWIATASPLIAYAGLQMAFAFYLGVLQDNGPAFDVTVLRDRLLGIVLGNVVMSLVFSTLWPVSAQSNARRMVSSLLARQAGMAASSAAPGTQDLIASAEDMDKVVRLTSLSAFDLGPGGSVRHLHDRLPALATVVDGSTMAYCLGLPPDARHWLADRLHHLAERYRTDSKTPSPSVSAASVAPAAIPPVLVVALDRLDEAPAPHAF